MTINQSCNDGDIQIQVFASGPAGPANELTVGDVYVVPSGNPPEVSISGTSPSQTINFGLPKGPKGDTGDAGGATDISVANWIGDDSSLTVAALEEWRGYRFIYVDESFGDGVTDATVAIQDAFDLAGEDGGGTVVLPPGDYLTTGPVTISANTRLLGYGATIHRGGANGMMLINWEPGDTTTPAYDGPSNITVLGLTLDGHAGDTTPFANNPNQPMTFAHCRNITVRDVRILRSHTNHALEFNAVDGALAENCLIEGWEPGGSTTREAIQIDAASPGVGAPDNTMATNVTVRNCRIKGYGSLGSFATGIGSHTSSGGRRYYNIHVVGCVVEGAFYAGIRPFNWVDSRVEGNWLTAASTGWAAGVLGDNTVRSMVVDNIITGHAVSSDAGTGIRMDPASSYLTVSRNMIRQAEDGITGNSEGGSNHCLVADNRIMNTFRYAIGVGGSHNLIQGNLLRRTNGASAIRFYSGSSVGNSVIGNQYRPDGDPAAVYAVSVAAGQSVFAYANDFLGAAALTSGTLNTTNNRI